MPILAHYGADELYCGLVPSEWLRRFGRQRWLNRRGPGAGNFLDFEAFREASEAARGLQVPLFLAVNSKGYTHEEVQYLLALIERVISEAPVEALIISDLGLLHALHLRGLAIRVHLSSLCVCMNSSALDFFRQLRVKRIILPRHLSLQEIEVLSQGVRGLELEAFILNDGCPFEEGFCRTSHEAGGPFCLHPWQYELLGPTAQKEADSFSQHLEDYREWLWFNNNCGCSYSEKGLPLGPCGLCALPAFERAGISAIKIAGREASLFRKLGSLQLVKAAMKRLAKGLPREELLEELRGLRDTPGLCEKGFMCYYREAMGEGGKLPSLKKERSSM